MQGDEPRDRLLRRFREAGNAILLGTDSFWEGVDVPGRALRVLLLCKLPFKVPSEPLTAARLERLAGRRLTTDGVLVITAQRHRTQERNREDARERLIDLIRRAALAPVPRRPTRPTPASRQRRLESKQRRAKIKRLRGARPGEE